MSDPKQPPLGEVDPSEGAVQDPSEQQGAKSSDAERQDAGELQVDPSEQPSNQ